MTQQTPAIEAQGLVKRYGDLMAVDDVSFSVERGEVFGLLGPNGAGKTTTVECIEGLRTPDAGEIRILGWDTRRDLDRLKESIGIQLQATGLYHQLTVTEVIDLFGSFYRRRLATGDLVKLLGLEEKARTRNRDLSGGQQQRLSLALALVNDPDLVFLDEPTTGLDPQARHTIWDVIARLRERGKTVLLTTHFMEEAERLCDRVAIMDHGRIIALDSPQALVRTYFHEQAIEFQTPTLPPTGVLAGLPGVREVRNGSTTVTCYTSDVPKTMAGLLDLGEQGVMQFDDLTVRRATLEDVFLKLTGRRIRE